MNLPPDFTTYTRQWMGESLFQDYCTALDETPPVSVRMNPWKWTGPLAEGLSAGPVPWCHEGMYLTRRPYFTFDPLLHAGAYYVQEASSMFLAHVLRQYVDHPVKMLDLCAAPGGKSITALTALPEGSLLFSNEPIRTRACILAENLMKLGCPDVVVTQNYPADYHKSGLQFDVVLTDAPCSGEGMFRKDPKAIEEWTPGNVENCRRLQREIVGEAWHCLRPGGLLVYSTCTLNRKENEDNVAWMERELGARLLPVDTREEWGITGSLAADWQRPVYRFLPGRTKGEGMFFAVMRKPGAEQLPCSLPLEKEKTKKSARHGPPDGRHPHPVGTGPGRGQGTEGAAGRHSPGLPQREGLRARPCPGPLHPAGPTADGVRRTEPTGCSGLSAEVVGPDAAARHAPRTGAAHLPGPATGMGQAPGQPHQQPISCRMENKEQSLPRR